MYLAVANLYVRRLNLILKMLSLLYTARCCFSLPGRNLCVCAISAARAKDFRSLSHCKFPLAAAASPKKDFCFLFGMNNWPLALA